MTGQELRALRKDTGLSVVQFATIMGVDRNTIYRWENGVRGISIEVANHARLVRNVLGAGASPRLSPRRLRALGVLLDDPDRQAPERK